MVSGLNLLSLGVCWWSGDNDQAQEPKPQTHALSSMLHGNEQRQVQAMWQADGARQ